MTGSRRWMQARLVLALLISILGSLATVSLVHATAKGPVTGFDMPRFVSLRSSEANVRTGPGLTYPVKFKYLRARQPLQVVDEFGHWRKVRDWQGDEGWIHHRMLTGTRTLRVTADKVALLTRPMESARPRALIEQGALLHFTMCDPHWCRVKVQDYRGWIPRAAVFGLGEDEFSQE